MSEEVSAPLGEPATVISSGETGPQTLSEAVRNIAKAREAAYAPPEKEPEEETPPPVAEPQAEENADPPPEARHGDATEEAEAAELPPIEPPKSWTKEEQEEFRTYPREAQEKVARREQEREAAISRGRREAAEKQKALEAELEQTAKVRQQYETKLPEALSVINAQIAGEFPDIRTWDDVVRMQAEDPFRYQKFDLVQKRAQAVQQELAGIQQRQAADTVQRWNEFAKTEDTKFTEAVPDAADPVKLKSLQEKAARTLTNIGLKSEEIDDLWKGRSGISMRDHRVQMLIYKAARWDEAEAKSKVVRQTPLPPVVKPGTARNTKADTNAAEIASLTKQLETAKGTKALDLAVRLRQARRAS